MPLVVCISLCGALVRRGVKAGAGFAVAPRCTNATKLACNGSGLPFALGGHYPTLRVPTPPSGIRCGARTPGCHILGNTPVVQLGRVVPDDAADVFVKLEWFNPTGSYKDRMALAMIEEAERRGDLRAGMIVEHTAGSTGSSLAYVCHLLR